VGGNLGFAAGPVLATLFYGLAGLGGTAGFFVLNSGMAILLWFYLSTITGGRAGAPAPLLKVVKEQSNNKIVKLNAAKALVPVVLLVLVIIMRTWVHFGMVTFLPQYYVHFLHHSETYAAGLTSYR